MYVYTSIYACLSMYSCVYARVACVYGYTWVYCVCMCVCVCWFPFLSVYLVACYSILDSFVRSELGNRRPGPDSELCPLWTRYNGDSKTDSWDDPQISIGSYCEDQTTIRFQNCVISCECLFLCISLFPVIGMRLQLLLLFHVTVWSILPVWLPILLHEMSASFHLEYVVDISIFLCHFICCYLPLLTLD